MKIIFVIGSISITGGAERVVSIMASYWAEKDWDVTIVTFDDGAKPPAYLLNPNIKHDCLGLLPMKSNLIKSLFFISLRMIRLKKYFKKKNPDAIISFTKRINIVVIMATLGMMIPVIVSERNNPLQAPIDPLSKILRKHLYPKAYAVVCQTQDMLNYFLPDMCKNGIVIPNPVKKPKRENSLQEISLPKGKILFAIGSMNKNKVRQKGFDKLIPLFGKIAKIHNEWYLIILGEGTERLSLLRKVKELKLSDRVFLPGNINDINSVLEHGDLFVLSSRYEGFPNALCEAMACGLPAVSFDCPTGPKDILRNGIDGYLVPPGDFDSLEAMLEALMTNDQNRALMGLNAKEVVDRFSIQKVMGLWENLLFSIR